MSDFETRHGDRGTRHARMHEGEMGETIAVSGTVTEFIAFDDSEPEPVRSAP